MSVSAASKVTRSSVAASGASSSGSICSSGRPLVTCTLGPTSTSRTRPWTGAVSEVSIFMLSVMATTSPAWTSSPADTGIATTTPGAWLRTRPPSSRDTRWGTPLTSTSRSVSCTAVSVRYDRPPKVRRRSCSLSCSTSASIAAPSTSTR